MTLSPEFIVAALVTTMAGVVMMRLGFREGAFKLRGEGRRCVSCGRKIGTGTCPNCADL
jgi:hypothetical protein